MGNSSRRIIGQRYRLGSALGVGGSGEVYLATDEITGREVALKLLDATADPARVRREVAALRALRVPGVVEMLDSGFDEGRPYIAMERVVGLPWPGTSARDWEALRAPALALLEVLSRVHKAGVIHRDLKPANVLVRPSGEVVLLDFGLARGATLGSTITRSGTAMGTPAYLAPEQFSTARVDGRADLYAAGVMLFEALAGALPHDAADLRVLWSQRVSRDAPHLSNFSPRAPAHVVAAVMRCLERRPEQRPLDPAELIEALEGERARFLPDRLGEGLVGEVLDRLRAGGRAEVWGRPGSGKSKLLEDVARTWEGEVVPLPGGARPFESLKPLLGNLSGLGDGRQVAAHVERTLSTFTGLILADDFSELDPWSQKALLKSEAKLLRVAPSPEALHTRTLGREEMEDLFCGPDRLLHLREDAAAELLRRTDGLASRVERQLRAWESAGQLRREGALFQINRKSLDLLSAEVRPRLLDAPEGEIPEDTRELVHLVHFAHPHASEEALAALAAREAWEIQLGLESLEELGAISRAEGRWEPRWELPAPPWSEGREEELHRSLAALLPPGAAGRLEHLIGGACMEEAQAEALVVAASLEQRAQAGAAIELLLSAADFTADPPEPLFDRLVELAVNRADDRVCADVLALCLRSARPAHEQAVRAFQAVRAGEPAEAERLLALISPPPEALRLPLAAVRFRLSQLQGAGAEAAFFEDLPGIPEDKIATWRGLYFYRRKQMWEAAASHERASQLRPRGSAHLSSALNAASAWMEAGEYGRAEALCRESLLEAREARHTGYESRAEMLLRSLYNRQGGRVVDAELIEAAAATGDATLESNLSLIEGWIAWRSGDHATANQLAHRCLRQTPPTAAPVLALYARSLACATGSPGAPQLAEELLQLKDPVLQWDTLGLLAAARRLPPQAAAAALQSIPPPSPEARQEAALPPALAYQLVQETVCADR